MDFCNSFFITKTADMLLLIKFLCSSTCCVALWYSFVRYKGIVLHLMAMIFPKLCTIHSMCTNAMGSTHKTVTSTAFRERGKQIFVKHTGRGWGLHKQQQRHYICKAHVLRGLGRIRVWCTVLFLLLLPLLLLLTCFVWQQSWWLRCCRNDYICTWI